MLAPNSRRVTSVRYLVRNRCVLRPEPISSARFARRALDMLHAMNTGQDGSLSTVHFQLPRDGLHLIETMLRWPLRPALRRSAHIAAALDLLSTSTARGRSRVSSRHRCPPHESDGSQLQDSSQFESSRWAPDRRSPAPSSPPDFAPSSWTSPHRDRASAAMFRRADPSSRAQAPRVSSRCGP